MIEIHEVRPNWMPPETADWVAVYVLKAGIPPWGGLEGVASEPPKFISDNNAPDIASAIDKARQWAKTNGVSHIYVIRSVDREAVSEHAQTIAGSSCTRANLDSAIKSNG